MQAPISGSYEAKIDVVDKVLDAASGTFGVRLLVENKKLPLSAGIRCLVGFSG